MEKGGKKGKGIRKRRRVGKKKEIKREKKNYLLARLLLLRPA
jgi:hypothetical protein